MPTGRSRPIASFVAMLSLVLAACGAEVTPPAPSPTVGPSSTPVGSAPASPSGESADVIFTDANVLTMDDARPRAEAVAVRGDRIVAVGTKDDVAAFAGPGTAVVSLGGLTLTPGFIDAHQHRIGDGPSRLGVEPKELIDAAIAQGLTTIDELYVDQGRLDQLRDLDESGVLRLRINAYLPVQENSPEGALLGDYYAAYQPGQAISPHVRVAGLKVFTDFDNAQILLWKQADLDAFLLARHQEGWQLAVKTVATTSLDMILEAFESVRTAEPNVVDARGRLEHMLFATPDQIERIKALGLVPIVNLNLPGDFVGDPDIEELIGRQPKGSLTPWRNVVEAGVPAAGMTGFPSLYADAPSGAPFGSPMRLVYEAVTRVATSGTKPRDAYLEQAITAEQAMRALTIDAARASFQDDELGSIAVGKLADMVVLSADPLAVEGSEIPEIDVLMTMIGRTVEWCAPGSEAVCPVPGTGGGGGSGGVGSTNGAWPVA